MRAYRMKTLISFAKWWNTSTEPLERFLEPNAQLGIDMRHLVAKFCQEPETGSATRMSSIGKPLIEVAYNLIDKRPEELSKARLWVITMGDYAELLIKELMRQTGHVFTHDQAEVTVAGLVGHIDGIVDDETVFDIKALSTTYWKAFTNNPNNDRGYLTQLSLYRAATKMPKAAFLCLNKVTGEMKVVKLSTRMYKEQIQAVREKLRILRQIKTEQDIVELVEPETPVVKKGKFLVPDSMQFSQHLLDIYGGTELVDIGFYQDKWLNP